MRLSGRASGLVGGGLEAGFKGEHHLREHAHGERPGEGTRGSRRHPELIEQRECKSAMDVE